MSTVEIPTPRLKDLYEDDVREQLRERNFMKIVSLAPEVL